MRIFLGVHMIQCCRIVLGAVVKEIKIICNITYHWIEKWTGMEEQTME